jgi:predicted nuclease of predicted toxin-antitoxin system
MKLLLDENLPIKLKDYFSDKHQIHGKRIRMEWEKEWRTFRVNDA